MLDFPRALQQQRSVLIYVEEQAVQGGRLQVHPDRLAKRRRVRTPGRAYGPESFFAPVLCPSLEMTGKALQRSARGNYPEILFGNRCGRKHGVSRRQDEIDADTDNDKLRAAPAPSSASSRIPAILRPR